jgi:hypothetical protein
MKAKTPAEQWVCGYCRGRPNWDRQPPRSTRRFCSDACRQGAYRSRNADLQCLAAALKSDNPVLLAATVKRMRRDPYAAEPLVAALERLLEAGRPREDQATL